MTHAHDEHCVLASGAICGGVGRHYRVYTHTPGARKYQQLGKPTASLNVAVRRMGEAMLGRGYNRAVVAMCDEYYAPTIIYELRRK